ncbi:MAG: maleylpyruvate isomerase family mycothiol-dependent enzyme [Acidimicrobiales bacterium]
MDAADRSAALEAEGRRLIAVATKDLEAEVPTCPGWRCRDLLRHVAVVWDSLRLAAESPSLDPPDFGQLATLPDDPAALADFAAERLDLLVPVLASVDPGRSVWTWAGEKPMAFWPRRAHLETVVHRVDAEFAANDPTPVDPWVGIDGVDELYTELRAGRTEDLPSGSFHLHQTDGDGEFMLDVVDGSLAVSRAHAKGDAALRATGEDLLLAVWGRRSLDGLEFFGDRDVAEQWIALAS